MFPYLQIFNIRIASYGLFLAIAVLLAGALAWYRCYRAKLNTNDFLIIAACSIGLGLIGAWLLYIFTRYSLSEMLAIIRAGKTAILFQGGLVYYGGFIGGVLGSFFGAIIARTRLFDYINPVLPSLPLGHAIGRIGCFAAGCCYGKPTDSLLGVIYSNPVGGAPAGVALFPVQLFEAVLNVLIAVALLIYIKFAKEKKYALLIYILAYGAIRFFLEWFRGDDLRGSALGLSTSQWASIVCIVLVILCYLFDLIWSRNKVQHQI